MSEDSFYLLDEIYLRQARIDLLMKKVSQMDEVCKKILCLNWHGKTMAQVAKALNLSYGYVRKKKCECIADLAISIKEDPEYDLLKW